MLHQKNYNDQNANRDYETIDERIKGTFVKVFYRSKKSL